ncbi:hypothetical protein AAFF_G00053580, partial [Aldrovandia affinis]
MTTAQQRAWDLSQSWRKCWGDLFKAAIPFNAAPTTHKGLGTIQLPMASAGKEGMQHSDKMPLSPAIHLVTEDGLPPGLALWETCIR